MGAAGTTFILCGGEGSRWNAHLGVPKQLADIDGVPLLQRTLAQLRRHGRNPTIVGSSEIFGGMAEVLDGVIGDNILETIARLPFATDEPTYILLGDVVFSEAAIGEVFGLRQTSFVLRPNENALTGKPYGEIFALRVMPEDVVRLREHIGICLSRPGVWLKLWSVLASFSGTLGRRELIVDPRWVVTVNDLTDDIDLPEDYVRMQRYLRRNEGLLQRLAYELQRARTRRRTRRRLASNTRRLRDGRRRKGVLIEAV